MAIDRITTAEIITELLNITGYISSGTAPWSSDANLIIKINLAAHRIPSKLRQAAFAQGQKGRLGHPMWYTTVDSTVSAGAANFVVTASTTTGVFPTDFDMPISVYDLTHNRFIDIVEPTSDQWYRDLREAEPGPTKAIHIQDWTVAAASQKNFRLLPDVAVSITPSMRLEYFRFPADVASGSSSWPDTDSKFQYLWVLETVLDLLRPDTPNYDRYLALEKEMIMEMATHLRSA